MWGKEKAIICNKIIETYEYEHMVYHSDKNNNQENEEKNEKNKSKKENTKKRENTLKSRLLSNWRAKKTLRRIINTNAGIYRKPSGKVFPPVFLTLTFKDDIRESKKGNPKFTAFLKRLNYHFTGKGKNTLAYSGVIEFQPKSKRVHYHVIFYNLPYIPKKKLEKIWGNGFIKIKKTDNIQNVGSYVCKYMSKSLGDARLCGQKAYFSSQGLKQPTKIIGENAQIIIGGLKNGLKPVYEKNCENEYIGKFKYSLYRLP
ncbi:MAG: hypothetical protein NT170_03480 [Candidatus Moranbacteria bacterium]|nr:hypothetical protein [Candidatus Moranbacteria bacterium]